MLGLLFVLAVIVIAIALLPQAIAVLGAALPWLIGLGLVAGVLLVVLGLIAGVAHWWAAWRARRQMAPFMVARGALVHVYAQCERCGTNMHVRLRKQGEIVPHGREGFVAYQTLPHRTCPPPGSAVFWFDRRYRLLAAELPGARLITREQYEAPSP